MLVYWLLFAFFATGALVASSRAEPAYTMTAAGAIGRPRRDLHVGLLFGAVATVCLIGLRYKVGADWYAYVSMFSEAKRGGFAHSLTIADPAFGGLNWLALQIGGGVWLVNLLSAAIFGWGLYRFCSTQPSPWLAFTIAVPYMIIVVAMGYTRQSIALGVIMAGLAKQERGASILNFALYVAAAAMFHKTAVIVFPIVVIGSGGNKILNFFLAAISSYLLYQFFLSDSVDLLVKNYFDSQYSSQGALIRVVMNLVAAILFFVFRGKLGFSDREKVIWRNHSFAAFGFLILLALLPSSTAVDRMSLYLMPLQVAVLTRVGMMGSNRLPGITAILLYLFAVEFTWLNFAQHAQYWLPYQLVPM